jgi:hypothetical protein
MMYTSFIHSFSHLQAQELAANLNAVPAREAMLGAIHQRLITPLPFPIQGGLQGRGDVELEHAFARLSTKQQQSSAEGSSHQGGLVL